MEELIQEKKSNLKKIDLLRSENDKLKEKISTREKKLDEAILKRDIAKSGKNIQKRDLERIRNPKEEKKDAIQTGIGTALTAGFIGTVAAGNINSRLVAPVLVASVALGATIGVGKLIVYKRFTSKNTEEELNNYYLRCQGNSNSALREIVTISGDIKALIDRIDYNNETIETLITRNKELSTEIGKARREEQGIQKTKKVTG